MNPLKNYSILKIRCILIHLVRKKKDAKSPLFNIFNHHIILNQTSIIARKKLSSFNFNLFHSTLFKTVDNLSGSLYLLIRNHKIYLIIYLNFAII